MTRTRQAQPPPATHSAATQARRSARIPFKSRTHHCSNTQRKGRLSPVLACHKASLGSCAHAGTHPGNAVNLSVCSLQRPLTVVKHVHISCLAVCWGPHTDAWTQITWAHGIPVPKKHRLHQPHADSLTQGLIATAPSPWLTQRNCVCVLGLSSGNWPALCNNSQQSRATASNKTRRMGHLNCDSRPVAKTMPEHLG